MLEVWSLVFQPCSTSTRQIFQVRRHCSSMLATRPLGLLKIAVVVAALSLFARGADSSVTSSLPAPLLRAHAHNDYEHTRPLNDALDRGFCSIEADVHLVDGKLLVAHDRSKARPERTLEALYLDPLQERVNRTRGRVYPKGPSVTLLIDVKSDADSTWNALRGVLARYADMLTIFGPETIETNAITVIITGNRARALISADSVRFAAIDGRLEDLDGAASTSLIPLVSDSWSEHFKWRGVGQLPDEERKRLRELVSKAHAQGRRIRFWGAPDRQVVWEEFTTAGVDLLNADDLDALQSFLLGRRISPGK